MIRKGEYVVRTGNDNVSDRKAEFVYKIYKVLEDNDNDNVMYKNSIGNNAWIAKSDYRMATDKEIQHFALFGQLDASKVENYKRDQVVRIDSGNNIPYSSSWHFSEPNYYGVRNKLASCRVHAWGTFHNMKSLTNNSKYEYIFDKENFCISDLSQNNAYGYMSLCDKHDIPYGSTWGWHKNRIYGVKNSNSFASGVEWAPIITLEEFKNFINQLNIVNNGKSSVKSSGDVKSDSRTEREPFDVSQLGRRGERLKTSDRGCRDRNLKLGEGRRRSGEGLCFKQQRGGRPS